MGSVQWVAVLAAIVLFVMSLFHLALAAGVPWGAAAWGGKHRILPPKLRAGSVAPGAHSMFVRAASWALAAYFALNTLGNLSSSSHLERVVMTPVAAVLAVCFAIVVLA
jgi:hypothetical protein